jgi:phosphoribosylamine---glycine ligase
MNTVLVVGTGGREHAIAWGIARSPEVDRIVCAPGNPGMATIAECRPVDVTDPEAIADLADEVAADLVIVGPESPLVAGAVDAIEARGRLAFGPRANAAQLEGSKAWMKELLASAGVPTARHRTFAGSDAVDAAYEFLDTLAPPYIVKTDGLAAGKGVAVVETVAEARKHVHAYLSGYAFGDAGRTLVIEEGLVGPELSLLVLCDGRDAVPLHPAQDFKRIYDGDEGPNTGGMGAYSPVPVATPEIVDEIMAKAVRPTLDALHARGIEYRGILYAGVMLTAEGPKIIEYNVRFGDPECQVVVPRLASDLFRHCYESARGKLETDVRFVDDAAVTVVLAAEGYPVAGRGGDPINGIDAAEAIDGVVVFDAGTTADGDVRRSPAGRALAVTALGPTLAEARTKAYDAAAKITWPGVQYRRDIALAAVADAS